MKMCLYFQVHQPYRLGKYKVFDIGNHSNYFDDQKNEEIMKKVARKCYVPTNKLLLELINRYKGKFKIAFSITGVAMEQFEKYAPEVLDLFKQLADTGQVEFLSETYYHSLSYIYSKEEFKDQVKLHRKKIKQLFGQKPKIFRNTELIFNNELANYVEKMGYKGILAEGADHILGWKSSNYIYKAKTTKKMKLLLKNYKLSDDIAFRFSQRSWKDHPLTVEKFVRWVTESPGETINLFMDYETFGEHQWEDTGIFKFLEKLPEDLINNGVEFVTPSQLLKHEPKDELDIHSFVSWADVERDLSAWLGNKMQVSAIEELYKIEKSIKELKDPKLLEDWRKLTISDHFYYMCTKWFNDGDVHKYFNPYDSPYEAFITFINILNDIVHRIKSKNTEFEPIKVPITETPSQILK
ncbi:polysaccharide deacetylase family protein [Candidatus Woesearchaeota archaeon]|nr:polysaccharide deacetylase family protein [Candidatus Woesearchaeota archaeon]